MLLPALFIGAIAAHVGLVFLQKHTQYRGRARSARTTSSGRHFWPGPGVPLGAGCSSSPRRSWRRMGGLVQINPVWAYGPFEPCDRVLARAARLVRRLARRGAPDLPAVRARDPGHHASRRSFIPGIVLPGVLFTIVALWPFDRAPDHRRPRRAPPARLAVGGSRSGRRPARRSCRSSPILTLAGGNDVLAVFLDLAGRDPHAGSSGSWRSSCPIVVALITYAPVPRRGCAGPRPTSWCRTMRPPAIPRAAAAATHRATPASRCAARPTAGSRRSRREAACRRAGRTRHRRASRSAAACRRPRRRRPARSRSCTRRSWPSPPSSRSIVAGPRDRSRSCATAAARRRRAAAAGPRRPSLRGGVDGHPAASPSSACSSSRWSCSSEFDAVVTGEPPRVKVDVTAFRWGWRFAYPAQGIVVEGVAPDGPELVRPGRRERPRDADRQRRRPCVLRAAVPVQAATPIPGRENVFAFTVEEAGTYRGQCAEFCGVDHSRMPFTVVRCRAPSTTRGWRPPRAGARRRERHAAQPPAARPRHRRRAMSAPTC